MQVALEGRGSLDLRRCRDAREHDGAGDAGRSRHSRHKRYAPSIPAANGRLAPGVCGPPRVREAAPEPMRTTWLSLVCLLLPVGCAGAGPTAPTAEPSTPTAETPTTNAEASPTTTAALHPGLSEHVRQRLDGLEAIDPERREALDQLAAWIATQRDADAPC